MGWSEIMVGWNKIWLGEKCEITREVRGKLIKVIPQFCIAHPVHVIKGISARAFREHGIVFKSMDQVKRYEILYCIILVYNFWGELKKIIWREKKIKLKACTKPVTRGCKLGPWKERLEERFESRSFKFAWFSHKFFTKLFHTLEVFFLSTFFQVLP